MIYRIDVRTAEPARDGRAAADPLGEAVRQQISELRRPSRAVATSRIYLIDSDASRDQIEHAAHSLLADPIVEHVELLASGSNLRASLTPRIEIHLKPGVTDPVAASTEMAMRDMGIASAAKCAPAGPTCLTGTLNRATLEQIAQASAGQRRDRIDALRAVHPARVSGRRRSTNFELRHVRLRDLDDEALKKLSREGHLFLVAGGDEGGPELLPPAGPRADRHRAGDDRADVERALRSQDAQERRRLEVRDESGNVVDTRRYENLIEDTIFTATQSVEQERVLPVGLQGQRRRDRVRRNGRRLLQGRDAQSSQRHRALRRQRPPASAGASATCWAPAWPPNRSRTPTCSASPIRNSRRICPSGVIHPKRILQQVVAGVRDYGNRMGIPTVNGAVYFDDRYIGNPLVFCGCVGLIPRDKIDKEPGRATRSSSWAGAPGATAFTARRSARPS